MSRAFDPIDVHVGGQVRARREALNTTQTDLARSLGVTFQQVQKYEKGANRISASMLFRAASFLGCTPGELFPASHESIMATIAPRPGMAAITRDLAGLTDARFRAARAVVSALASEEVEA